MIVKRDWQRVSNVLWMSSPISLQFRPAIMPYFGSVTDSAVVLREFISFTKVGCIVLMIVLAYALREVSAVATLAVIGVKACCLIW